VGLAEITPADLGASAKMGMRPGDVAPSFWTLSKYRKTARSRRLTRGGHSVTFDPRDGETGRVQALLARSRSYLIAAVVILSATAARRTTHFVVRHDWKSS
jgi:hypothetical protein